LHQGYALVPGVVGAKVFYLCEIECIGVALIVKVDYSKRERAQVSLFLFVKIKTDIEPVVRFGFKFVAS
jgi:hypothetical protein